MNTIIHLTDVFNALRGQVWKLIGKHKHIYCTLFFFFLKWFSNQNILNSCFTPETEYQSYFIHITMSPWRNNRKHQSKEASTRRWLLHAHLSRLTKCATSHNSASLINTWKITCLWNMDHFQRLQLPADNGAIIIHCECLQPWKAFVIGFGYKLGRTPHILMNKHQTGILTVTARRKKHGGKLKHKKVFHFTWAAGVQAVLAFWLSPS